MRITIAGLTRMSRRQRLGVHPVLEATPMFLDGAESRAADEAMWEEFAGLDLLDEHGGLSAETQEILTVLGRPSIEYFGWFTSHGRGYGVLVAGLGRNAIVAVRGAYAVRITPVSGEPLAATLLRQLPVARPAHLNAVHLRRTDRPSSVVRQLIAEQPAGLGELYVAVRDRFARRRTTIEPVRYRDTSAGRLLVELTCEHLSLIPADHDLLGERLRAAHDALIASP